MSLLASLAFALAAFAVIVALRLTIVQYRDAAWRNIAALRDCNALREFRVQAATVVARPTSADVRRIAARNPAPRRVKSAAGLRAAA